MKTLLTFATFITISSAILAAPPTSHVSPPKPRGPSDNMSTTTKYFNASGFSGSKRSYNYSNGVSRSYYYNSNGRFIGQEVGKALPKK